MLAYFVEFTKQLKNLVEIIQIAVILQNLVEFANDYT